MKFCHLSPGILMKPDWADLCNYSIFASVWCLCNINFEEALLWISSTSAWPALLQTSGGAVEQMLRKVACKYSQCVGTQRPGRQVCFFSCFQTGFVCLSPDICLISPPSDPASPLVYNFFSLCPPSNNLNIILYCCKGIILVAFWKKANATKKTWEQWALK